MVTAVTSGQRRRSSREVMLIAVNVTHQGTDSTLPASLISSSRRVMKDWNKPITPAPIQMGSELVCQVPAT